MDPFWPDCRRFVWPVAIRFLLRELACINFSPDEIKLDETMQVVSLKLTASKADPAAKGVTRTLKCDCSDDPGDPAYGSCPFHAMSSLVLHQSCRLRIELKSGRGWDFPLVGTVENPHRHVTKEAMIAALRHDIHQLKLAGIVDMTCRLKRVPTQDTLSDEAA